jgi:hypothetical protein
LFPYTAPEIEMRYLGGRTLEVIATPGIRLTPSLCSIAPTVCFLRGDTYYPAPIWLRPETDLDAYAASIRRLAALVPG